MGEAVSHCDSAEAPGRCRPEHCSKAYIDLHYVTNPQTDRLAAQEALLRLMQRGGCRGTGPADKACAAFSFFAAGELVRHFALEPLATSLTSPAPGGSDRSMYLWDALTIFIRNALTSEVSFDQKDLEMLYSKMFDTFRGGHSYELRAKIVRSFSSIAGARNPAFLIHAFWNCLDDFRAWCESAAEVLRERFPPVMREMVASLLDIWDQVLSGHPQHPHAVFKVAETAPHLLELMAEDPSFLKQTGFLVWHRMMMKFKRVPHSDHFQHVEGSFSGLEPWLRHAREVLAKVRTSLFIEGEFKEEIDDLFPILRGEEKAPQRYIPGGRPLPCHVTFPGREPVEAHILDIGVVPHLGFRVRCPTLRIADAVPDAPPEVVHVHIKLDATGEYQPVAGRFGIVRAWPTQQGSEWAVLADEGVDVPAGFKHFVEQLPPGRHRPQTQES